MAANSTLNPNDPDLALFKACVAGDADGVANALALGANPNKPEDISRVPPLAWAVRLGHDSCLEPLIAAGASAWNAGQGDVKSTVGYAIEYGRWDLLEKMVSDRRIQRPNPHQLDEQFMQAVAFGQAKALPHLAKAGYWIDKTRGSDGPNALGAAAYKKDEEVLRTLLALGADPNIEYGTGKSQPSCAASRAIDAGWAEGLRILLEAGANPGGPSSAGRHSLASSAVGKSSGSAKLLDVLDASGVELIKGGVGEMLLCSAAWAGVAESIMWLCDRGVDPAARFGTSGKTALEIADLSPEKPTSALIQAYALSARERREIKSVVAGAKAAAVPARRV